MPNLVNRILVEQLGKSFSGMGSCLVLSFDRLTPKQAHDLRRRLRGSGLRFQVVKNRLAQRAFAALELDLADAFRGKCGVVIAPEEKAIAAAKLVREAMQKLKEPPLVVTGGVIEGQVITGAAALAIADMPDKNTVRAQLVGAIAGVARSLAACVQAAGAAGIARATQARIDQGGADAPPQG